MSEDPTARHGGPRRPTRRGVVALLCAAALATCTDDHATGPGRGGRGYLAVRPVVVSPVSLASVGLTIDTVRVAAVRPVADTVVDTTVFFNPLDSILRLALPIELQSSTETFTVLVELWAGSRVLFSGTSTVQVSAGPPDSAAAAPVTLVYVGPGAGVTHITLAPRDSVITFGQAQQFRVTADANGVPVDSFYVSWSTSDPAIPITSQGILQAPNARGKVFVRARAVTASPTVVGDSTAVTFIPLPVTLGLVSGSGQTQPVVTPLPLRVVVKGGDNIGIQGIPVAFQALTGGGSVKSAVVVTDGLGFALDTATLGTTAGSQSFQATVAGLASVVFTATATAGAISVARSVVTSSSATVTSGAGVTLTLQAKDAYGNNLTSGGAIVVFSATGGTSTGAVGATIDNGNGTYSATFTGQLAGTAKTIGATINGVAVTSTPLPTIAVTPGAISVATSVVTTSIGSVASGASIMLTLQAKDAAGNALTTGGATVVFTRSGGTSTGTIAPSPATDNGNGTYTASFVGMLAGTPTTIGATINGSAVTTTLPTVVVTAGGISAATSVVTTSSGTVTAGSLVTLTLQAKDVAGNNLTAGGATVVFSASGGTSTGSIAPSPATDNGNGTYSATFIGASAGTATTIGATINGAAVTSALPTITVLAGPISAATSVVSASATTVQSGGVVTLTLQAKDVAGNALTTGGATVLFTPSGGTSTGTVTPSPATDNGNGTYSALFVGMLAGTPTTIGATVNGTVVTTALPSLTVTPGAISAVTSVVTASSGTVAAGAGVTLTLQAKDAAGNNLTAGGATVVFSASGGTSTGSIAPSPATDNGNGTYQALFTGAVAGTATTIGATINGSLAVSTALITVVAGNSTTAQSIISVSGSTVPSGSSVTLTLQARDSLGNNITTGGITVVFNRSGGTSTGTIAPSPATDNGNGTYTASFTGVLAGTTTTIGATMNGAPVTSTLPTVAVTPGGISAATSLVTVSGASVASGSTLTLTLQSKDAAGNTLTTGGATVVFTASGGTSTGSISATTDQGNGTYSATFTGASAGTATTIGATVNGAPVTSALPTVTVTAGAISTATSVLSVSSATIASGASGTLTLQAKDVAGNNLTSGGATVVFSASGGTSTGIIAPSPATDNGNGTYSASFTGVLAGTATTIAATINGAPLTSPLPTLTVLPGAASTATSVVSVGATTVVSGSFVALTLQAKDAAGNTLTGGGLTVVFGQSGGTSTGIIAPTPATDNGNGTYSASFTGVIAGTATTIGATINAAPVTSTLPTLTVVPGPISAATSTVTVSDSVVPVGSIDTLFLRARDSVGNPVTIGGAAVAFTQSGGTSAGVIGSTTDLNNGTYRALFTALSPGTPITIGATIGGTPVTSLPLPTIRVNITTHSTDLVADSTWTLAESPHLVTGYLRVRNGAKLTIEPGAVVKFDPGAGLQVGDTVLNESGGLILDGSSAAITLTANTATPTRGFWRGLEVQRSLPVPTWRRALIEYAGGSRPPFGGVLTESCVLLVNRSGAPLDLDSLRIRQCVHAAIHHFGGSAHVHRSQIDTVTGSGIHAAFDAQLELDSTTIRGAGEEGLFIGGVASRLLPSSANQFRNNAVTGIHLQAVQLPGLLQQDSIVGNGSNVIVVDGGQPDPAVAAFTIFAQPQPAGSNGYLIQGGLLDVGRVGGQAVTLDSSLVLRFNAQTGLVIGDSAGTRSGSITSLGTNRTNAPRLTSSRLTPAPGDWYGLEIGRLASDGRLANVRVEFAGDSIPGRSRHRFGLLVRSPAPQKLSVDSVIVTQSGRLGSDTNSAGIGALAAGAGVEFRRSVALSNPAYGFAGVPGVKFVGDTARSNTVGFAIFSDSGGAGVFSASDSLAGNVATTNTMYPLLLDIRGLPVVYANAFTGNGRDTLVLDGGDVTFMDTLPRFPGLPWRVRGPISIDSGAVLTIDADTMVFDSIAGVFVGGAAPAALVVDGANRATGFYKRLMATPGHPRWLGIVYSKLAGTRTGTPNVFRKVIVERGGQVLPPPPQCDCNGIALAALRVQDVTSGVDLVFDSIVVRRSSTLALDVNRGGAGGKLTVQSSQFYANPGTVMQTASGAQLTVTGSDIYAYRTTAIHGVFSDGTDPVNATGNWWGDVAGAYPGSSFFDSLGRASFGGTDVNFQPFATTPFFPAELGPANALRPARDTLFFGADTVLTIVGQTDSIRVRVVDGNERGVSGSGVTWGTSSGTIQPGSGSSDLGGRVGSTWHTGSVSGLQTATASGVGTPVVFALDLLPGNTLSNTVDWQVVAARTVADSVHSHPGTGVDTIFSSSTDHKSALKTNARDGHGNATQPNIGPLFDQGPCSNFACRFPAADSVKFDTIFFRPPAVGSYVISGLYESGAGGGDQVQLIVTPVAYGVRIDRQALVQGVDTLPNPFVITSVCRTTGPLDSSCQKEFSAFVVDSGLAPIGNGSARLRWLTPAFPDTIVTQDGTRGAPANDTIAVTAHAPGTSWLVVVDTASASATFNRRDSMPILVRQVGYDIVVTPDSASVLLGNTATFRATVVDTSNAPLVGDSVHWRFDSFEPGKLTIVDTSVFNKVTVRADSTPFGSTFLTAFWGRPLADTAFGYSPFDTLQSFATVFNPVQTPIDVGGNPYQASVNPLTNRVYVSNVGANGVTVLDGATDAILATVDAGGLTMVTAVNPKANRAYVARITTLGSNILAMSGATNAFVDSVGAGFRPSGLAVDTARNRVYVAANSCFFDPKAIFLVCSPIGEAQLIALNGANLGQVLASADSTPGQSRGIAYNPVTGRLYVAVSNGSVDTVRVIDAASLTAIDSIQVGAGAFGVAVNPVTNRIYVTNETDGTLSVIDGATNAVVATVFLGFNTLPEGLGVDPNTNRIYVSEAGVGFTRVIDGVTNTEIGQIFVGGKSTDAQPNPVTGRFYVVVYENGVVKAFRYK